MLKNVMGAIVLPFLFLMYSLSPASSSEVEIYNMTDTPLVDLQVTVSGLDEPSWSGNLLYEGPLLEGYSISISTANDVGDCIFHVWALYSDEGTELIENWDFCNSDHLEFTGALKEGGEVEESLSEEEMSEHGVCTLEDAEDANECAVELAYQCEQDPGTADVDCDEFWQIYSIP